MTTSALGLSVGAKGPDRAVGDDPMILASFEDLSSLVRDVDGLGKGERNAFSKKVENAEAAYRRGQACTAVNVLGAFLNHAQAIREERSPPAGEALFASGHATRQDVARAPLAEKCAAPEVGESSFELISSDLAGVGGVIGFGAPRLSSLHGLGETWTRVTVPGTDAMIGEPGLPAIPMLRRLVGVPEGAEASVAAAAEVGETLRVNLVPHQRQPEDQSEPPREDDFLPPPPPSLFADPPFVKDEKAYAVDAFVPETPCAITPAGAVRDLHVAVLECAAGAYNPMTDELVLYRAVRVDVRFTEGTGAFVREQTLSPFESSSLSLIGSVVNAEAVLEHVGPRLADLVCVGEELLILTHPTFRPAADSLAAWKNAKGILTTVLNVMDGAGPGPDTRGGIDALIEERYETCIVRLSYVLLMGDSEFIPTFYRAKVTTGDPEDIGTDHPYATYVTGFFDILADFAVGRIPVDTLSQAQTVVDKIVKYESNPPASSSFYKSASFAAQFQCCRKDGPVDGTDQRTFIEISEQARDHLLGKGYDVERIYTRTVDDGDEDSPPYTGDPTPRRYYDGVHLPADLGPASGFPWDGDTADILDAFDEGRFLVMHRDHGWPGGWGNPHFDRGHAQALTNGDLLPVVYSVNCASGIFDNEQMPGVYGTAVGGSYFAERLLRNPNGGAVGILGDSRNSPSWPNTALTRGFFDATWPDLVPAFGGGASERRLGDILNHGKLYLLTQVGVPSAHVSAASFVNEMHLWHVIGDPTLEMWTQKPTFLGSFASSIFEDDRIVVHYAVEGAVVTALQPTEEGMLPIGRAVVEGGVAEIPHFHPPDPKGPIVLSASLENGVSTRIGTEDRFKEIA